MKKIPWFGIGVCSAILVVLVIGRSAVTAGRVLYYGGTDWLSSVRSDPWFYVGMAAAAICVVTFLLASHSAEQKNKEPDSPANEPDSLDL